MSIYSFIQIHTSDYEGLSKNRVCSTIAIWVKSGIRVSSIPFADKASQSLIDEQIKIAYIYIDIEIDVWRLIHKYT